MRSSGIIVFALCAISPLVTHARVVVRGQARLGSGFTDNPGSGPDAVPDGFLEAQPGILMAASTAKSIHQIQASLGATLFLREENRGFSAVTGQFDWVALHHLTPSARLQLGAGASVARQNLDLLQRGAGSSDVGPRATGAEWFTSGRVAQGIDWEFLPNWTLGQTAEIDGYLPLEEDPGQATTTTAFVGLSVSRSWARLELAGLVNQGYAYTSEYRLFVTEPGGQLYEIDLPPEHLLFTRLSARVTYQLSRPLLLEVVPGVLFVVDADIDTSQVVHPVGVAVLRYAEDIFEGEVSYEHTIEKNLFISDTFMLDRARMRARLPLTRPPGARWWIEGTVGYDHGLQLNVGTGSLGDQGLHVFVADIAVTWQTSGYLDWSLRYQFSMQQIESSDAPPTLFPPPLETVADSFIRNLIVLTANLGYPGQNNPSREPRNRRRVDQQDWDRMFDGTPR